MAEENKEYMPRLRFPEFRKASTWKTFRLGDNCKITASGDLDASAYSPVKKGEYIYPVYSNAIVNNGLYGFMNKYQHEKNNITITARGTLGVAFLRMEHFNGIGRLIVVEDLHDIIPNFLCEYWNYFVEIPIETTSIPQLTVPTVKKISIKVPSLPEQQKIADCLSSLDELIEAHEQKRDALLEHKKGLMQRLFPAEGETTPRWRFPEFRKGSGWRKAPLGSVAIFYNGRAYSQEELLESGKYRVLRVGNLFNNGQWYYSDFELEKEKYCDTNDLLYAWSASFGPFIWTGGKVIYHYHIWKVVPKSMIDKKFLYYILNIETDKIKKNMLNGLGIMHVTKSAIEKWECHLPSLPEQQKIADCLSSLDARIEAQEAKIASLREHKQGLMQGLFPQSL